MVEFPIIEEFRNYIYYNLETIFLFIVPIASLIGFLTNRVMTRIKDIEKNNDDSIQAIDKKINKAQDMLDRLNEKLNVFEVDVSSDIAAIKTLLSINDNIQDLSNRYKRRKRNNNNIKDEDLRLD